MTTDNKITSEQLIEVLANYYINKQINKLSVLRFDNESDARKFFEDTFFSENDLVDEASRSLDNCDEVCEALAYYVRDIQYRAINDLLSELRYE